MKSPQILALATAAALSTPVFVCAEDKNSLEGTEEKAKQLVQQARQTGKRLNDSAGLELAITAAPKTMAWPHCSERITAQIQDDKGRPKATSVLAPILSTGTYGVAFYADSACKVLLTDRTGTTSIELPPGQDSIDFYLKPLPDRCFVPETEIRLYWPLSQGANWYAAEPLAKRKITITGSLGNLSFAKMSSKTLVLSAAASDPRQQSVTVHLVGLSQDFGPYFGDSAIVNLSGGKGSTLLTSQMEFGANDNEAFNRNRIFTCDKPGASHGGGHRLEAMVPGWSCAYFDACF